MITINYFSAPWCAPCKMFSPTLEVVSHKLNVPVNKVNVEENRDMAMAYDVRSVPTLVLMKDGTPVGRHTGIMSKDQLEEFIKSRQ